MAEIKYDGVVEAVHYTPEGRVEWVRVYERRGAVFSDRLILKRDDFIAHLKSGKRFYTGKRIPLMAGTFEVSQPVRLVQKNGEEILLAGEEESEREHLKGVPII